MLDLPESTNENNYTQQYGFLWNEQNISLDAIQKWGAIANLENPNTDEIETTFSTNTSETELADFLLTKQQPVTSLSTETPIGLRSASKITTDSLTGIENPEKQVEKFTDEEPPLLFSEVSQKLDITNNPENSLITRQRPVKLDFSQLDGNTEKSDKTLKLNLFQDVTFDVEFDSVKTSPNQQNWVWIGKIEQEPNSQVIIISSKDETNILGEVRIDYQDPDKKDELYEIRTLDQDNFVVNQLNLDPFPQCYICGQNHLISDHQNNDSNLEDTLGKGNFDSVFNKIVPRILTPTSGNKKIDGLLAQVKWDTGDENTITYSFLSQSAANSYYGNERVSETSNPIKTNVREIFDLLEQYIDVEFQEVADSADSYGQIRIMFSDGPSQAQSRGYTYYPPLSESSDTGIAGDIHLSSEFENDPGNQLSGAPGSYGYITLAHEIGHGLGLKHPHDPVNGKNIVLSSAQDNNTNTMMTYSGLGGVNQYSTTPMPFDIQALQYLYGSNSDFNSGNTTYSFDSVYGFSDGSQYLGSSDKETKLTIWDAGGFDTIDLSKLPTLELEDFSYDYRIDLREGGLITTADAYNKHEYIAIGDNSGKTYKTSSYGTAIAYDTVIENLINSAGDDLIYANNAANKFSGYKPGKSTGDDKIIGASGDDTLDLSDYRAADVKRKQSGKDLVLNLGKENGSIRISNYYGVKAGDRLKILFNEPTKPQISINDITVNEGDTGKQKAKFTVSLSEPTNKTVKVKFATADDTAKAGSDYQGRSGTVTFKPGQTTKQISVPVLGDITDEFDETFLVKLRKPENASIADNKGVATIKNDDLTNISIKDATVTEGNSGTKNATFRVSLDQASVRTVKVDYKTIDTTAIAGSDYTSKTGTLRFKPGQKTKTIKVPVIGDKQFEDIEYFYVRLSNPSNVNITDGSALGTINNND